MGGTRDPRPLIVHVIYRLAVGGLENGLVNLINRLPSDRFRHGIISLTELSAYQNRIQAEDVECIALHKREGNDLRMLWRLWRLFRVLRPNIVHSRNLAALEAQLPAWLAGVPIRIHGEHGRDVGDLDGSSRKHQYVRRLYRPFIHRYVPLSKDLGRYLRDKIHVPAQRIRVICNGVDVDRFRPAMREREALPGGFVGSNDLVIGTVGRLEIVKDQATLVRAFIRLVESSKQGGKLRLVVVGDGSQRSCLERLVARAGIQQQVWFAGDRRDVPDLMGALDVFVLPSLAEGISNTILEAMACGLPVVATDVGGNAELVVQGKTGFLVPREDPEAMASAIARYWQDSALRACHSAEARTRAEREFSIASMVTNYQRLYEELLDGA